MTEVRFDHALASTVTVGSKLKMDGDFTCMKEGVIRKVHSDEHGLYVNCGEGRHHLDGQLQSGRYVGMELVK